MSLSSRTHVPRSPPTDRSAAEISVRDSVTVTMGAAEAGLDAVGRWWACAEPGTSRATSTATKRKLRAAANITRAASAAKIVPSVFTVPPWIVDVYHSEPARHCLVTGALAAHALPSPLPSVPVHSWLAREGPAVSA